ncbi:MAG: UDP-N-acetylglucosamine 4,6-dehydratase (inverting) [candidate division Zixibacteria bacterium]|nr:UDP-N-acetylglucosamine 4,6-dehydratase (inverting) [Candidatus Tariuqbacter arcticus]
MDWKKSSVLITGGTGSFGSKFVDVMMKKYHPRRIVVFSRDELKQLEMYQRLNGNTTSPMRYFIGDVRDKDRLYRAFRGVDIVIHAAALKQVPTAEYNPLEVIKTNILGAANVIDAAIDRKVKRVIALSTDKAVNPINLYGATKLCADKLFTAAGVYGTGMDTIFSVVRYGNVLGSRGSVVPFFKNCRSTGVVPITDPRMTRFWLTLEQAVEFVVKCAEIMRGGEVFVPKIPSMRITDLAEATAPECRQEIIGIRPGEKLNEVLLTEEEIRRTVEFDDFFIVKPTVLPQNSKNTNFIKGKAVPEDFQYSSNLNDRWLSVEEMCQLTEEADES